MENHPLSMLAQDRQRELRRLATEVAEGRRAGDRARLAGDRPLPLRLLARVLGPR